MKNLRNIMLGIYLLITALGEGLAQEFWKQTNGPYGGYVGSLFTMDNNIVLAGTRNGIFRSEDGGMTWSLGLPRNSCCFVPPDSFATPLFFLLPNDLLLEQTSYVVDFSMDSRGDIYAATFDDWLYKSTDKGKTWTEIFFDLGSINEEWNTTAITVNHNNQVFLGTQGGIVRSNDYGLTWQVIQTGLPDSAIVKALAVDNNNQIWAGLGSGKILRSASLEYFNLSIKENFRQKPKRFLQDPISLDQEIVNFESLNGFSPSYGLYKLPPSGDGWQMVISGEITGAIKSLIINNTGTIYFGTEKKQLFRYRENPFSLSRISLPNLEIAVPALASNSLGHVFVSFYGYGLARSTNDGISWESIHSNEAAYYISALSVNNSNHIFAGSPRGVFRSLDNGQSLQTVNRGLLSTDVQAIAFNDNGDVFTGTLESGFFLSKDKGQTWSDLSENFEVPGVRDLVYNKKTGQFFAATTWGVLRVNQELTDAEEVNEGLTTLNVTAMAINDSGHIFVTTVPDGVFRSKNNGDSWKPVNTGLTNTSLFAIAINQSNDLFVGLSRSTNNGETWRELNPEISDEVFGIAINKTGHIFASAFLDGIYRSINNGGNWQETGYFGIVPPVESLTISNNGDIYAGSWWYGVYVSRDNGEKWGRMVEGLPEITWIRELAIDKNGFLYTGTNSFGIFRSREPVTSVKDIADGTLLPKSTTLLQNYPNPFNPTTTISYFLDKAGPTVLKIYDTLGKEIRVVVNEHQSAGKHRVTFEAANLASGLYFYSLTHKDRTIRKKLLLLR